MGRLLVIVVSLITMGCASNPSVSEHQCRAGDWQTIGYRDGTAGLAKTRILVHQEACGEFGIVPDRSAYMAGWNEGIPLYCTHENGFRAGERGARRNLVCEQEVDDIFRRGYDQGREIYIALSEVNAIQNRIAASEARLLVIDDEMLDVTAAQLDAALTPQERIDLVADLKRLADEKARLQSELPVLISELSIAQENLQRIRDAQALAYNI